MTSKSTTDLLNKVYFFAATIAVGFVASMGTKKLFKVGLGLPQTLEGTGKISVALAVCAVGVDYAQEKKWIPKEPFSKMGEKTT